MWPSLATNHNTSIPNMKGTPISTSGAEIGRWDRQSKRVDFLEYLSYHKTPVRETSCGDGFMLRCASNWRNGDDDLFLWLQNRFYDFRSNVMPISVFWHYLRRWGPDNLVTSWTALGRMQSKLTIGWPNSIRRTSRDTLYPYKHVKVGFWGWIFKKWAIYPLTRTILFGINYELAANIYPCTLNLALA